MWICPNCNTEVESTELVCPKCGASQFEKPTAANNNVNEKPVEQEEISSGVNGWSIAYIVFGIIFLVAALFFWGAGADSYSKKDMYYDSAVNCLGLGIGSFFMSSLVKGFGFVIKASKLYLKKNNVKID